MAGCGRRTAHSPWTNAGTRLPTCPQPLLLDRCAFFGSGFGSDGASVRIQGQASILGSSSIQGSAFAEVVKASRSAATWVGLILLVTLVLSLVGVAAIGTYF